VLAWAAGADSWVVALPDRLALSGQHQITTPPGQTQTAAPPDRPTPPDQHQTDHPETDRLETDRPETDHLEPDRPETDPAGTGGPDQAGRPAVDGWRAWAWHDLLRGDWRPEEGRLGWRDADGLCHSLVLTDPGDLPPVFRERIDATFLVEERVELGAEAAWATVQRPLGDWCQTTPLGGGPLVFRVTAADPARPLSAELATLAQARLAELRRDLA
jgi:hypothetical protein